MIQLESSHNLESVKARSMKCEPWVKQNWNKTHTLLANTSGCYKYVHAGLRTITITIGLQP